MSVESTTPGAAPAHGRRQVGVAFVAGLLFALGLGIAGMTDPNKVLDFLDVTGAWNPSLGFVMGGAILVYMPVYRALKAKAKPLIAAQFHWPSAIDIDARLVIGSSLFGLGWGAVGLCPGPAVVAATTGSTPILIFFAAMAAGMLAHHGVREALRARRED